MLPIIQEMCRRFSEGEHKIYRLIPHVWNGTYCPYFPVMWLTFLPIYKLGWDIRWTSILLLVALSWLILRTIRVDSKYLYSYLAIGLMYVILGFFIWGIPSILTLTEESIVYFYYGLLSYALIYRRPYLIGLSLALCMLSRYSAALWLTFYFGFILITESKVYTQKVIGTFFGTFLIIFFYSGAYEDINRLLHIPLAFTGRIEGQHIDGQGELLDKSLGLMNFMPILVFRYNTIFMILLTISTPIFSAFFYSRAKNKINKALFSICSLKFCLVFFYNFLALPFIYLFPTLTIISIFIWIGYTLDEGYATPNLT